MLRAHVVVYPPHKWGVDDVGGDEKIVGVVDLEGDDAGDCVVGEPDLTNKSAQMK